MAFATRYATLDATADTLFAAGHTMPLMLTPICASRLMMPPYFATLRRYAATL